MCSGRELRTSGDYLAAGGTGFLFGDGALRYGVETFVETHYRAQVGSYLQVGPDVQYVRNPGVQS